MTDHPHAMSMQLSTLEASEMSSPLDMYSPIMTSRSYQNSRLLGGEKTFLDKDFFSASMVTSDRKKQPVTTTSFTSNNSQAAWRKSPSITGSVY